VRINLPVSNVEVTLPDGVVIVSKTDLKGIVTYCNDAFVEISGYRREELIGTSHNLVRHPDMPPEAFADLWKTIKVGKPWQGIVKNRRKDGSFYWVEANVTPLRENDETVGYVSFRYKAIRQQIDAASSAYQEIREGSHKLHIENGKVIRVDNRLLYWLMASSIKFRLLTFMSILLAMLVVIGGFGLREVSKSHDRTVNGLAVASTDAYALDTARIAEALFKEQRHAWKNILLRGHDAALFKQHFGQFEQKEGEVGHKLAGQLQPIMEQLGMPADQVDELIKLHIQMGSKYRLALKSFDRRKPESVFIVDALTNGADQRVSEQFEIIIAKIWAAQLNSLGDLNGTLEKSFHDQKIHALGLLVAVALGGIALSIGFLVSILRPIRRAEADLDRVVQLQQQFLEKILVLEEQNDRVDEEQRIGSFIMGRMTDIQQQLAPVVHRYTKPAGHLSGDVLIAASTPANVIHVLLADAVGHGLTAAINVLPLCQAFYDLTDKGFSIERIATDLNLLINQFMPVDRFVSATLISINHQTHVIEVWNGGIPALQLFSRDGSVLHSFASRHMPLGILPGESFSAKPESVLYEQDCQLCLFSDGFVEARSPQGEDFGNKRVVELLGKMTQESRFDGLVIALERHLQGESAHDDISLALVDISLEIGPEMLACHVNSQQAEQPSDDWRIAISLGASELKYLDVVPLLTQIIANIHVTREHHSSLFLILSELFNNALDHGVLQLDSGIKHGADGFDKFLQQRVLRMQALSSGKIGVEIERALLNGMQAVKIRVTDSGKGFDYTAIRSGSGRDQLAQAQYGRGIALVKSLAYKLEYAGNGNDVAAYYICA